MKHESPKAMAFYFLQRIDYTQTWEEIRYGLGYDFGDFRFNSRAEIDAIERLARQIHIEFNKMYDSKGAYIGPARENA